MASSNNMQQQDQDDLQVCRVALYPRFHKDDLEIVQHCFDIKSKFQAPYTQLSAWGRLAFLLLCWLSWSLLGSISFHDQMKHLLCTRGPALDAAAFFTFTTQINLIMLVAQLLSVNAVLIHFLNKSHFN